MAKDIAKFQKLQNTLGISPVWKSDLPLPATSLEYHPVSWNRGPPVMFVDL